MKFELYIVDDFTPWFFFTWYSKDMTSIDLEKDPTHPPGLMWKYKDMHMEWNGLSFEDVS